MKALDLLFQLHERLCNSNSWSPRALVECYVQTAMCKLNLVQTGMCKMTFLLLTGPILIKKILLLTSSFNCTSALVECYVQTAMCKLEPCANWYVQNDIFASNFLNNGPILINFFCLKALDLLFQLHERSCNSTSARGAPRALVECSSDFLTFWLPTATEGSKCK